MADPNLSITVHVERLESIPAAATDFYFGLNLSTALHNADGSIPKWDRHAPDYARLAPWKWDSLQPRVWVWKRGEPLANAKPIPDAVLKKDWDPVPDLGNAHLLHFVNERIGELPSTQNASPPAVDDPFYWNSEATIGKSEEFNYDESEGASNPKHFFKWLPFLQNVSRLSPPIPQRLNLSHLVLITAKQFMDAGIADPAKDLFAVFVCLDAKINTQPVAFSQPPVSMPLGLVWDSATAGNESLPEQNAFKLLAASSDTTVFIQPVILNKPAQPVAKIDMHKLWVRLDVDADGYDPLSQTVQNLTFAFDPAQHLVDVLRKAIADDPDSTKPNPVTLHAMSLGAQGAISLSRELAHCGNGTTGFSLVERVGTKLGEAKAFLLKAISEYEDWLIQTGGLKAWIDLLSAVSPQLNGILRSDLANNQDARRLLAALETFAAQLADASVLEALIIAQWREACLRYKPPTIPSVNVEQPAFEWTLVEPLLRTELAHGFVRRSHQEAWMAILVKAITAALDDRTSFAANVADALQARLTKRLQTAWPVPVTFPPEVLPLSLDLLKALATTALGGAANPANTRQTGVEDAHPILFVVDTPATDDPSQSTAADDDLQRHIAGVAILLRKDGAGEKWHCLNMANLFETKPPAAGSDPVVEVPVIKPSSLAHVNGQRQAVLPYDNQLLGAINPVADAALNTVQDEIDPSVDAWLRSEVPEEGAAGFGEFQTPALVFGQSYHAAALLVTNSGQIPAELVEAGKFMKRKGPFPLDLSASPPPNPFGPFTYQRRTPVGAPRIHRDRNGSTKLKPGYGSLLPLPGGVRPLACELDDPTDRKHLLVTDKGPPLLLLGPEMFGKEQLGFRESFEFNLRLPNTPHKVWERWQRNFNPRLDFGLIHGGILSLQDTASDADYALDDPAVEKALSVSVQQVFPVTGTVNYYRIAADLQPREPSADEWKDFVNLLHTQQAKPVKFQVRMDASAQESGFDPAQRVLVVKPGEVWRFRAQSVVKAELFGDSPSRRPMSDFVAQDKVLGLGANYQPVSAGTDPVFLTFSPYDLVIECAQTTLPTAQELWQALRLDTQVETTGSKADLLVQLDRNVTLKPAWATVGTIELQRQRWKWHARPTPPPPERVTDDLANALWDAIAYTLRDDEDHVVEAVPFTFEQGTNKAPREMKRLPLADDSRCLHFRWSLSAVSRYSSKITQQATKLIDPGKPDREIGRWKRILVKSRLPAPDDPASVAPPALKLVLPITDSWLDDEVSRSPGLLCVFHDEWYEKHGLSEILAAGIPAIKHPGEDKWFLQYGPDPILQTDGLLPIDKGRTDPVLDEKKNELPNERVYRLDQKDLIVDAGQSIIEPPVGHTFDRLSVTTPRVLNTSFVLRVPTIPKAHFGKPASNGKISTDEMPEGWRFVQLRFQRRLVGAFCQDGEDRFSAWTSSQWVQLLHSRTALLPDDLKLLKAELGLKATDDGWQIVRDGNPLGAPRIATRRQGQPVAKRFAYWLVLTRPILDTSREAGEAYVDTLVMDSPGHYARSGPNAHVYPLNPPLFARWVEVQTRDIAGLNDYVKNLKENDLWLALFPLNPKQDAVARITNVSPRVNIKAG